MTYKLTSDLSYQELIDIVLQEYQEEYSSTAEHRWVNGTNSFCLEHIPEHVAYAIVRNLRGRFGCLPETLQFSNGEWWEYKNASSCDDCRLSSQN